MEIHNNNCQQFFGTDIDGEVIINGNVIHAAKELKVKNNMVFINGKPVEEYSDVPLKIEITGSVKSINTTTGIVHVQGDVTNVKTMSGSVHCQTVKGNVNTMSGGVKCRIIEGDCSTMSGSIRKTII